MAFASHGGLSMRSLHNWDLARRNRSTIAGATTQKLPGLRAYPKMSLLSLSVSLSLDLSLSDSVSRFLSVFSFSESPSSSVSLDVVQRVSSSCSLYPW